MLMSEESSSCIVRTKSDQVVLDALTSPVANVKSVDLRNLNLDQLSVGQLGSLFGGCGQECQSLALEKCTLSGDRFLAMVTDRLTRNRVTLAHFRAVSCQQVTMTSLIAISTLFTASLVTLELSSCKLPRQAGIILSQSLQACTSLKNLLLADNNIRDGGLRAIADALKLLNASSNSAVSTALGKDEAPHILEHLDISRNGITSSGFASLQQLPLRCLSARGNMIESGAGALLLSNASTLETLCLLGNPLSEDGKLDLVRSLFRRRDRTGKSALRELDLRACGFNTADSLDLLQRSFLQAATASQQCSVQTLHLDSNVSTDEGVDLKQFQECCESLQQVAKTNFPGLRLHFQSDSHIEMSPKRSVHPKASNISKSKAIAIPNTLSISGELEAVAIATKTSVNATLASVTRLSTPPLSDQQELCAGYAGQNESVILHPLPSDALRKPTAIVQAHSIQPSSVATPTIRVEPVTPLPTQHVDVEYIVTKTIECMSHNFELRLGQFLSRMETQQTERNASQVQLLAAKVEACERALPRFEARLDMLTDRVAAGSAQLSKLQSDVALQLQHIRQEALTQQMNNPYSQLSPTASLTSRMQSQVDELVSGRVQASEERLYADVERIVAVQAKVAPTDPNAVVNAVSMHLSQFKREFDTNQAAVLRQFTENTSSDGRRLEDRIERIENQIDSLETVIQSEQQASLLALEAISDAFNDPAASIRTKKA
ncbi:Leucine Rich repeat [Phytophthora infestans]|uniref:Leucine Rich repeat n=1 Tax=Phytophthora infestans TaxID=4787 RepID=A0A833TEI1_PHYIN|nr:Leucine Rich repeat [Phytophthora infestans]